MNRMRTVTLHKVVVNIGVGEAGERLERAKRVLELITTHKPVQTLSRTTNKDHGIRDGMPIGTKVTLRGDVAHDFLKRAFWTRDNRIASYSFDPRGNFSFGIGDYTDFEGMKYDPDIGIFGMDVSATLSRSGFRIARRRIRKKTVPERHRVTMKEGQQFLRDHFNVEVVGL